MSKLTRVSVIALMSLSLTLSLSACKKEATGQVVAVVNGEEITLNELNSEITERNVPATADKEAVRKQILQQMVERRLLAQAAKEDGIDREASYIDQERRMKESLLVNMYGKKALETVAVPTTAAVDQYIASHPNMFADRTGYRLDQIRFDMPKDTSALQAINGAHSMTAIIDILKKLGITFQRGNAVVDSAQLSPEIMQKIQAIPAGEPFVIGNGNKVLVNVIIGSQKAVLTPEQARPIAAQAIRQEELAKIGKDRLATAKAKAKVVYQKGFELPANDAKPAPGAATAPAAK